MERIAAVKPAHAADLIGVWGTAARILVGLVLVGSVLYGHATGGWHPVAWLLGLIVFPAVVLASLWWRARRNPEPMRASGPVGHAINAVIFLALYLTWWYAPTVDVLSDAALIFYGASMLLAAARGYAGCEVLAVSKRSVAPRRPDRLRPVLADRRGRNTAYPAPRHHGDRWGRR